MRVPSNLLKKNYLPMNNLSYWEKNTYFKNIDIAIIGSGIVGLNAAICLKKKNPKAKIIVFERGLLPSGASSKNAGFACFGSPSELLDDIAKNGENSCFSLVEKRWKGLLKLRELLGDEKIDFHQNGSFEIFSNKKDYERCETQLEYLNNNLKTIFDRNIYNLANHRIHEFGLNIPYMIENTMEGQIDTGKMISSLIALAAGLGVIILNNCFVKNVNDFGSHVSFMVNDSAEVKAQNIIIATNGFAKQFAPEIDVEPARAQVLITAPIENLKLKGSFHYEEGYYYFRNIHNRVLLGGGRNLDFKGENTTEFGLTPLIQNKLEQMLSEIILPYTKFEIEHRWSGIMGVGSEKKPIVKKISDRIVYAVRMGGMGVAIGSLVGEEAAALIN
jgi:glycine/D-amino acid oxidase-like deaminating enzyme